MKNNNYVAIDVSECCGYPVQPYNPPKEYPELCSSRLIDHVDVNNQVYDKVRNILKDLKLDKSNINTDTWNPFSEFISENDHIVIKPNLVVDHHPLGDEGILCTITNASLIRPVIDYILLATKGKCKITICDAPVQSANWDNLINKSGLSSLVNYYSQKGININLLDLRIDISVLEDEIISKRVSKETDPLGYAFVDLGIKSELMPVIQYHRKFRITDYKKEAVSKHHNPSKNEYYISKTVLDADVFINLPKIKTHRKAGITCSLKNLVGINGDKKGIAHHRAGCISHGGDEYPKFKLFLWLKWNVWNTLKNHKLLLPFAKLTKKIYLSLLGKSSLAEYSLTSNDLMEGSWHGNDTIWRCVLDINKILLYADKNGVMNSSIQRNYFCLVDGIISAENEGPMQGSPKKTDIIIAGFNPVAIDKICSDIMGFDYMKIPLIREGFKNRTWNLVNFPPNEIEQNLKHLPNFHFHPSKGWYGHIEKDEVIIRGNSKT